MVRGAAILMFTIIFLSVVAVIFLSELNRKMEILDLKEITFLQ